MVAGEVDLTAVDHDEEEELNTSADAAAADQPDQAGPSRGGARTRRSAPLPPDDDDDDADAEVMMSLNSTHYCCNLVCADQICCSPCPVPPSRILCSRGPAVRECVSERTPMQVVVVTPYF